jgi:hypothetical protein
MPSPLLPSDDGQVLAKVLGTVTVDGREPIAGCASLVEVGGLNIRLPRGGANNLVTMRTARR